MPSTSKMNSGDRILSLSLIDDKAPLSSTGLTDSRLFTGENKLHAMSDPQTTLWSLKYDSGTLPQPLKQQFTSFGILMKFVTEYFKRRNINVKEERD